jgi:hypothetical protein
MAPSVKNPDQVALDGVLCHTLVEVIAMLSNPAVNPALEHILQMSRGFDQTA